MKRNLENILKILSGKEKQKMFSLVVLNIVISILDIASLAALLFIIAFYSGLHSVDVSSFFPGWLFKRDSALLILLFLLLFILKSIAGYLVYQAHFRFVYNVASRISKTNLLKYLEGSYSNYVNIDSSVFIRKITQQPIEFCHYVLAGIQQIITEGILIILAIIAIFLFNAKLFAVLFVLLLPAVIIMSHFTKKKLKWVRANIKTSSEKTLQYLKEALSGFIESNVYDKNVFFTERYASYQKTLNKYLSDLQITQAVPSRLIEVFAIFGLFILIAVNNLFGIGQSEGLVNIAAFMAAAYKIIPGIAKILNISGQVKTYEFTITDLLTETHHTSRPKAEPEKKLHSIAFKNVSFSSNQHQVLLNLNLQLARGDFLAISGLSGKGKTTAINLLLGFLEPQEGSILLNGQISNAMSRQIHWRNISYVKQQPFLIHDTILKNITLDENHFDKNRLQEAIAATGLHELINKSPEGIHTTIRENGKNISGGQRQRITIARALYKDADLIILDEPFNELDKSSQYSILQHIKNLSANNGKMIILISHNKEILEFSNKIISVDAL